MPTINAYIPTITPLLFETEEGTHPANACLELGDWNDTEKTLTPIRVGDLLAMPHNPGARMGDGQPGSCRGDARAFRITLREAGADCWLTDRHHNALRKLGCASIDATAYPAIASVFDSEP